MTTQTIYKSLSKKYSDWDIRTLSGVVSFVSYHRLMNNSIKECLALKSNEEVVGLKITDDGITCIIETK